MAAVVVGGANLLFASKVLETARALALEAESAPADSIVEKAKGAKLVLLDVERLSPEVIRAVRSASPARIVGFGSHVAEEILAAARESGCDEVLSRGQLTARLPQLLKSVVAG